MVQFHDSYQKPRGPISLQGWFADRQIMLFEGYDTFESEFESRDPRMAMTFIVPGSEIYADGGIWAPTYPGFVGTNATQTGYMLRKFLDETLEATQFQGQYDFKEFRYGEVLLILAEALYELDGQISDADLDRTINLLRARAGMPSLTTRMLQPMGWICLQRSEESALLSWHSKDSERQDLRRWKVAEEVLPSSILGVKFEGTEYETEYPELQIGVDIQVGFIVTVPSNSRQFLDKHYLDPIPLQQIQLSKGTLEQNTGGSF